MDNEAEAALASAIDMLETILKRQIELHTTMVTVAENKRESIIKGDIEALEKVVAEERRLVGSIEEEEKQRQAVMPLLRKCLGLDDSVEKLMDVIEKMPEPRRSEMTGIRNRLRDLLEQCRLLARHNAELLKTSLDHVEAFLRGIAEAASQDAAYNHKGKRSGGGPTIIDRSA